MIPRTAFSDALQPNKADGLLERDTLQGYDEFLSAYPDDPMARRVQAIIAARREAITWRRTYSTDTPDAYWSYLGRYPGGPHAADARRRLAQLSAALTPPPAFAVLDYDVPPRCPMNLNTLIGRCLPSMTRLSNLRRPHPCRTSTCRRPRRISWRWWRRPCPKRFSCRSGT
jgi:hypothetical protein